MIESMFSGRINFLSPQVNAVYLEKCIDKLSEEELMDVKVLYANCDIYYAQS